MLKIHLSYKGFFALAVLIVLMGLGAGTVNSATTAVTYQVSAGADDGYAWSAAEQDISSNYLLIGDDRTYTAPYYMSAMRFTNIDAPRNAQIVDAHLKISSISEGLRGQIYGLIRAEAADDAADFRTRYIGTIIKTTAATVWDHKDAWSANTYYTSPDISGVIQEVVSRDGWNSGNSMAIFYSTRADSGKSRKFGSFEAGAGFAAVLEITYETYSISGYVKTTYGTALSGAAVSAGAGIESTETNASGYYELKIPPGWLGTVSVSKEDWGFNPWSRDYTNLNNNQINQDYTAFQPKISGYVKDGTGAELEGVLISSNNGGGSDTTDATGHYEITVPYDWSGTVTPSTNDWGFNPASQIYSNVISDLTAEDYIAFQPIISGYVTDTNSIGLEGVLVSANNSGGSGTTDAAGYYEITVPYDWSGTVTPSKTAWGFNPINRAYSSVIGNQLNQDYTALFTAIITVTKDGTGDLGSIQEAIDASEDGFKIIVFPGTYSERINLYGKNIALCSTEPGNWSTVNSTVINGNQSGSVVTFSGSESSDCILEGFAIIGGSSPQGAGINGSNSHAVIKNCVIKNHSSWAVIDNVYGAGVYNFDGKIINCIISNNVANSYKRKVYGAGLAYCDGEITNCFITNNTAKSTYLYGDTYGGGLYGCNAKIRNCLILGNSSSAADDRSYGGGLSNCNGEISNTIIWGNTADIGSQLYSCSTPSYSCIMNWSGGGIGNFNSDPLLAPNSYNLTFTSPCLDSGDPNTITAINETDIDSQPRFVGKRIDIGVDEFAFQDPFFLLSNNKLDFTALEARQGPQQAVELNNLGLTALNWTSSADVDWLEIVPSSGSVNYEETETINIIVDINDLSAGNYSGQINIIDPQAANNPKVIDVNLTIIGPSLGISHNIFNFEASKETLNPSPQTLTISNSTGGGTLNWIITSDCNWIAIEPNTGAITEGFIDVMLDVDQNNIEYGNYSCQFTVSDPNAENSPQIVAVNLEVLGPAITVSPAQFYFETSLAEPNTTGQILSIQNTGYDTLHWQITIPPECNWLTAHPMSGQSYDEVNEVTLSIDANGMDIGFYTCELTISDPNAENNPQTVQVSLHVYTEGQRHVPAEYPTIQAAIDAAVDEDEVIIEPGRYTGPGNYDIEFRGKAITVRSVEPNNPAIVAATIIEPNKFANGFRFRKGEQADSVINGLTIRRCIEWAAINCVESSPTIQNCVIEENYHYDLRYRRGASIACYQSSPVISNCAIRNNYYSGLRCTISEPIVRNCTFTGNRGSNSYYGQTLFGGGILFEGGDISVINCTFSGNLADVGGGICSFGSYAYMNNVTISNCIFWDNDANDGPQIAVKLDFKDHPSTVSVYYSDVQGGEAAVYVEPRCTLHWDNDNNLDTDPCFAEPGYWEPNGTPEDVNDDFWVDGDYHLKSQKGRWKPSIYIDLDPTADGFINMLDFAAFANSWQKQNGFIPSDLDRSGTVDSFDLKLLLDNYLSNYNSGQWVLDNITSPCIDAGDPNLGLIAELWPHGLRINMGAYGGMPEASMSLSDEGNIADLNWDGSVGYADMIFMGKWLYEGALLAEDFDRNGFVNLTDVAIFTNNWQGTPCQASNPNPANNANLVDINVDLSWTAGYGASSHDVYFGTSNPPPFICNQTSTTFDPGLMSHSQYYWRIDEVNTGGKSTGTTWFFMTNIPPPPLPPPPPPM